MGQPCQRWGKVGVAHLGPGHQENWPGRGPREQAEKPLSIRHYSGKLRQEDESPPAGPRRLLREREGQWRGAAGLSLLLTSLSGLGPGLNVTVYAQVLGQMRLPVLLPPFPALMAGGYSMCG